MYCVSACVQSQEERKREKKKKKSRACASTFVYVGVSVSVCWLACLILSFSLNTECFYRVFCFKK